MAYALRNRQVFSATVNGKEFTFTCYTQSTSYGVREICCLGFSNTTECKYIKDDIIGKDCIYNRPWYRFKYENALNRGIKNLNESEEVKQALHDILIDKISQEEHEKAEKEIQAFQNLYNQTSQEEHEKAEKEIQAFQNLYNQTSQGFKDRIANSGIVMNSDSDVQAVKGLMLIDIVMNK
jgi:hypothetical protein